MERLIKKYSFLLLMIFFYASSIYAKEDIVEKTKKYSQSFQVNSTESIKIKISFGNLKIVTWKKPEVKIEASMSAKSGTADKAQDILEKMNIISSKENGQITFESTSLNVNNRKGTNESLKEPKAKIKEHSIDLYENESFITIAIIYVPEENYLIIENGFGDLNIGDHLGPMRVRSSFGTFTLGRLRELDSLQIGWSKGSIEHIGSCNFVLISNSYARINNISGSIYAIIGQSSVKLKLSNDLTKLNIIGSFNKLYLETDKNLSAIVTCTGQINEESDFMNKTSFTLNKEKMGGLPNNMKFTLKAGEGFIPIRILNNFSFTILDYKINFDINNSENPGIRR